MFVQVFFVCSELSWFLNKQAINVVLTFLKEKFFFCYTQQQTLIFTYQQSGLIGVEYYQHLIERALLWNGTAFKTQQFL